MSEDPLDSAVDPVLAAEDSNGLPVVDPDGILCGWLGTQHVLRRLVGP